MQCYICEKTDDSVTYVCNKCKELCAHKRCYKGIICTYCFQIASIRTYNENKRNTRNPRHFVRKRRWDIIVSIMKQWKNNVKTKCIQPIYRKLK